MPIDGDLQDLSCILEDILGCKWTVNVLRKIASGKKRPGDLIRSMPGLSQKVLNQRLKKLLRYSIIERKAYEDRVLKVEYKLTPLGRKITRVLSQLNQIEAELMSL